MAASLEKYQAKRKFDVTPEPSGDESVEAGPALSFCIQKHAASHLHYDFRLELDGVLKSWAVAKGPSFVPKERRLAVEVEDHPLGYGGFEGIIPQGEYGGGTVMLWDRGTWEPMEEPHAALAKGAIKFVLHGEKLTGHWTLIRMPPRPKDRHPNWLLIKEKDEVARPDGPSLPDNDDESVLSHRTMAEIAGAPADVWQSKPAGKAPAPKPEKAVKGKARPLGFVAPELATLTDKAPAGNEWLHEIKFDGYRLLARVQSGKVSLFTRTGLDWTERFGDIADQLKGLADDALIDGEVVIVKPDGTTDFAALQARLAGESTAQFTFYAFDLLRAGEADLRNTPLIKRKEMLQAALKGLNKSRIVYSDHVQGSGEAFFTHACKAGLEGIVSKRADGVYKSGRVGEWLKVKCGRRQEFVICGYVPPATGMKGIGSLAMGYHDGGKLVYAGRVGTGYTEKVSRDLRQRLDAITVKTHPFKTRPPADAMRGAVWVNPKMVAEVSFAGMTGENLIRHGAFKGLREDKKPEDVVLEETAASRTGEGLSASTHSLSPSHLPPGEGYKREEAEVAGVRLTHPDKVVDEESGLTKFALASYYEAIGKWIMPHIADRPLSIVRCPEGVGHPCFFQRHLGQGLPKAVHMVKTGPDKDDEFLTVGDVAGLVSLVQMGALELHPWGAPNAHVERSDRLIFDLDPDPSVSWETTVQAAFAVRDRLKALKLKSWVKTTGGKGLHIVLPLDGSKDWQVVKKFAHDFAFAFVAERPREFVAVMSKAERRGKIFIDYLRNDRTATAVAPYSTRARVGAPVAVPLAWEELNAGIDPRRFDIHAVQKRLAELESDPWKNFLTTKQGCPA